MTTIQLNLTDENGTVTTSTDALVSPKYSDEDTQGLPLGIENSIVTSPASEGELSVSLRHMPLEAGQTVKTEDLADEFCAGNEAALPDA